MVKLAVSAVGGIFVLIMMVAFWPLVSIQAGHVGVVTLFGQVSERALEPGIHLINPLAKVIDMSIQQQALTKNGMDAGTKDLQSVASGVVVNIHLDYKSAPLVYSQYGLGYAATLVDPVIPDRLKSVTSKFNAEELITKREEVRGKIRAEIIAAVSERSKGMVIVDDVVVSNFGFVKSFTEAVENKQVAEQLAAKAKNDLERIKVEAEQRIATARGEAEAIRIQAQSISAQGGAAYVALKTVEKWDGALPIYNTGPIPFVELPKYERK